MVISLVVSRDDEKCAFGRPPSEHSSMSGGKMSPSCPLPPLVFQPTACLYRTPVSLLGTVGRMLATTSKTSEDNMSEIGLVSSNNIGSR